MIGILVTGHGKFGSGLTSSLELIAGNQNNYQYVDFVQEYSVDDLKNALTDAIEKLNDCSGILILTDIPGGSPFKTAVEIGYPKGNVNVVSGTNLPMLIEVTMARKIPGFDLEALTNTALNTGKDQVVKYEFIQPNHYESDEGI